MSAKQEEDSRRKNFAVAVLAQVWAGAVLPPELIQQAMSIESEMRQAGSWARA